MLDVVRRMATAGSTALVAALGSNVPLMRTAQRRLLRIARLGVADRQRAAFAEL